MVITKALLVINDGDEACHRCYTYDTPFDDIVGGLCFRLCLKIIDALKYFGLYTTARRVGTDRVQTVKMFSRCDDVDREKAAGKERFISYVFPTSDANGLNKESL